MKLTEFLQRSRDRKLASWGLAYLAGAWVILQVAAFVGDAFGWSPVVARALTVLAAGGFLLTLVLGWYHGERGAQRVTVPELAILTALLGLTGVLLAAFALPSDGRRALAEQGSIAVLPFESLTPGEDAAYFSDGMTEEILNALSRVPGLRVAARTSSFAVREGQLDVAEIGGRLGVAHVLEGTVRREGERLRVRARLVETGSGFQVWSETYDRRMSGVFAIQDDISRSIVDALQIRLRGEDRARSSAREVDLAVYELYLRGSALVDRVNEAALREGVALLREALRREPGYAPALVRLSHGYIRLGIFYDPPDAVMPLALDAATRALELDPDLPAAHTALAFVYTEYRWDWAAADRSFQAALALDRGAAGTLRWYQNLLRIRGRCGEAIRMGARAAELDPLNPVVLQDLGYTHYYCRQHDEAVEHYTRALRLDPGASIIRMRLAMALEQLGRHDDAVAAATRAAEDGQRGSTLLAALGRIHATAGQLDEARAIARELEGRAADGEHLDATYAAALYTGLGEIDTALGWLERAYLERSPSLVSLRVHPWHDPLRGHERFRAIQERMRL